MPNNYRESVETDVWETVEEFVDQAAEQVRGGNMGVDLLNDYAGGDGYHHQSHVNKDYTLAEAVDLLDQLKEYEETDEGLWEGKKPKDAIRAQAAYTYGGAVLHRFRETAEKINVLLDSFEVNREAWLRAYVILKCRPFAFTSKARALADVAIDGLEGGSFDLVLIFCDWLEERDSECHGQMAGELRRLTAVGSKIPQ